MWCVYLIIRLFYLMCDVIDRHDMYIHVISLIDMMLCVYLIIRLCIVCVLRIDVRCIFNGWGLFIDVFPFWFP